MIGSAEHPLFTFGLPADALAWGCLILAALVLFWPKSLRKFPSTATLGALALSAALLSWFYFEHYLGGGPRVIDATAYLLEARTFARGAFSFEIPDPTASFRGRFLVHTTQGAHQLAPIFPPGYPALLSLAVRLGNFMLLGPLLAAALVIVTYRITLSLSGRKQTALVAATLSVLCACLRYHTAETMSHGAAALFTALAAWASIEIIRERPAPHLKWWLLLGGSLGALISTRQLTGALVGLACLLSIACRIGQEPPISLKKHLPAIAFLLLAALPGIALLLAHQHAITGDFLTSPQTRYYALADGPADCFGIGLGKGCHYEHADVVAQQGGKGLTLFWALKNTLHRIHWHSLDVANFEPLFLIAVFMLGKTRHRAAYRPLRFIVLCLPLGYAFFYFNGSYPGGGARFFSELLPLWHALLAVGLCALRITPWGLSAALVGFSLHASFSHRALASAHFGPNTAFAPRVGERLLAKNPASSRTSPALVFFSSAHLFNASALSSSAFVAARRTRDSREAYLVDSLKPPSAWIYESQSDGFSLIPWTPTSHSHDDCQLSLEVAADYPVLAAKEVWAHPESTAASCLSTARVLRVVTTGEHPELSLETLPGSYRVELIGLDDTGSCQTLALGEQESGRISLALHPNQTPLRHLGKLLLTPPGCPPAAHPH